MGSFEEPPGLVSSSSSELGELAHSDEVEVLEDREERLPLHFSTALVLKSEILRVHRRAQKHKLEPGDKDKIETAVQQTLGWLYKHYHKAEKDEFKAKQAEFEGVVNPLMMRISEHHPLLKKTSDLREHQRVGIGGQQRAASGHAVRSDS